MAQSKQILIIDDDAALRSSLAEQLELHEGFTTFQAEDGKRALELVKEHHFEMILIDVGLPDTDGRDLCRLMRRQGIKTPMIMLTAHDSDADTILGLDSGANDYIPKPFRLGVLLARLRAQLRQFELSDDATFPIGPYTFRPSAKMLLTGEGERKIHLTEKETAILKYLYRMGDRPVGREVLLDEVWGYNAGVTTHTLETHIYRLRQKIEPRAGQRPDPGHRARRLPPGPLAAAGAAAVASPARNAHHALRLRVAKEGVLAGERVQRRLAAILAMDMVGYSRQMAADEAGTLVRFRGVRNDVIDPRSRRRAGGSSSRPATACWWSSPAPSARSNARSTSSASWPSATPPRPSNGSPFRIGINLGDVIVEGDDIYGDGVNIAARLESIADPGGILVAHTVFDQVKRKIEVAFEDLGERALKNIAEPVHVHAVVAPRNAARRTSGVSQTAKILERPAIAVLPLVNMSADPEQEYFADGLTEDLITALSHWRLFPVIARNSVFTYKGRSVKVQQVAEELGARYVLEGSVRKVGRRVRITVQLIDAGSGHHIWADKFDREIEDVFAVQDEITRRVATTLQPELVRAEERRSVVKIPADMTAWDYVQRGLSLVSGDVSVERAVEARQLYARAIEIDPDYSQAYTALAFACQIEMVLEVWTAERLPCRNTSRPLGARSISTRPMPGPIWRLARR